MIKDTCKYCKHYDKCKEEISVRMSISCNGIDYTLEREDDGWVTIYETDYGIRKKLMTQACSFHKAKGMCVLREKPNIPLQKLI